MKGPGIFLVLLSCLAWQAIGEDSPVLVGAVTRVTDGDTITVGLSSGPITVRFDSIDAPEKNQPWGQESRDALAQLLDGEIVNLEVVSQDRYDRLVAVVYLGEQHINTWMVEQGHAWAYRRYMSSTIVCELEDAARTDRRGLWSQQTGAWVAPWEWRRSKSYTDYSNETLAGCLAAKGQSSTRSAPSTPQVPTGECRIKGNISDSGRIYHVPESPSYKATRIDESRGERWFCSEQEARTAGWRAPRG